MSSNAELRITGIKIDTWHDVVVRTSLLEVTPDFSFSFTSTPDDPLPVGKGMPCEVLLHGLDAVTGYINRVERSDKRRGGNRYAVSGRGRTQDLVDSSARHPSGRFVNQDLRTIVEELCAPSGIQVVIGPDMEASKLQRLEAQLAEKFRKVKLRPGDKAHNALQKLCKDRGVIMHEQADGRLALTRAGATKIPTKITREFGEDWIHTEDDSSVFSEYEVLGSSWNSNAWNGDQARGSRATAQDEYATRFRPLTINADRSVTSAELEARALFERNRRHGLAETLAVTVPGWLNSDRPDADLWRPNQLIDVENHVLGIQDTYLVVSCEYTRSRRGSRTRLELSPPEAFEPFDPPKPKPARRRRGGRLDVLTFVAQLYAQLYADTAANVAAQKSGVSKL